MARINAFSFALAAVAAIHGTAPAQQPPANPLPTLEDQVSYAIGLDIGQRLLAGKMPVKPEIVARGLADGFKKAQPLMTKEQCQAVMTKFEEGRQSALASEAKALGEKNLREGQAFLATNKVKPGVQTTATGVQYLVIKTAAGPSPKATDTVRVHYKGMFLDGSEFDSSDPKEPAKFRVGQVIPGWTEALQLMKVGEKWKLFLPSDLAYGPAGTPDGTIPPNAVLVFDVELLEILK